MKSKLLALFVFASTFSMGCGYVLDHGKYVWKCDPKPNGPGCRYVYQCGGTVEHGCHYVLENGKMVLKCSSSSAHCKYIWTCG